MIASRYVASELESVTRKLELQLYERAAISEVLEQTSTDLELAKANEVLQTIKEEADACVAAINGGQKFYTIKYDQILTGLEGLSSGKWSMGSPLEPLIRDGISDYLHILLYYALLSKNLEKLPQLLSDQEYYGHISRCSWIMRLFYGLQIMPVKMVKFIRGHTLEELPSRLRQTLRIHNFQLVGLPIHRTWQWTKLPIAMVDTDIIQKTASLESQLDLHVKKFGKLLREFPRQESDRLEVLSDFLDLKPGSSESAVVRAVQKWHVDSCAPRPNWLVRYWPTILLALAGGPAGVAAVWQARSEIAAFIKHNLFEFARDLVKNWLVEPLRNIWSTVHHDPTSSIAIMSQGTLDTEINSLQRMLIDFLKEHEYANTVDTAVLLKEIEQGNLTQFMEIYESQLRKPIRNLVTGDLIRSLLIQIQKGKVDGSLAIHGIDKLLQSQQLVFGIVSISPALLILYLMFDSLKRLVKYGTVWSKAAKYRRSVSVSLNNVERLLNSPIEEDDGDTGYWNLGLLTLEMANLREYGAKLVPHSRTAEWSRDIDEMASSSALSTTGKLNVINRIYHVYGKYF
ncbi:AaceriAFR321Cp [[Ashbya] aceris (nom. inval.)]|nr:AaceriAFR321Cp [[Ashbya] aceris (nom. inval.)]